MPTNTRCPVCSSNEITHTFSDMTNHIVRVHHQCNECRFGWDDGDNVEFLIAEWTELKNKWAKVKYWDWGNIVPSPPKKRHLFDKVGKTISLIIEEREV